MFAVLAQTSIALAAGTAPTGPTTTTLTSVPAATADAGTSVTFTAAVTLTSGGTAVTLGTVKLVDTTTGTTVGGPTAVDTTTGKATFTTSGITLVTDANLVVTPLHVLQAQYVDSTNGHNSNGNENFNLVDPTTTTLTASPATPGFGTNVTFSMTVKDGASGAAIASGLGHIKLFDNNGGAVLAAALAVNTSGQATFSIATLAVGVHPITAQYTDASSYTSQANLTVTISVASTTTMTSSANPSTFGSSVTLTATVTSSGGTPTGQINFQEGLVSPFTTIGSAALNGSGVATLTTTALAGGSHSLSAAYVPAILSIGSSTSTPILTQVVNHANSTTTVVATQSTGLVGGSVQLVATVTTAAGTPGGSVTFTDGASTLGVVSLTSGSATLNTSALGAGSHTIVATYSGSTNFNTSNGSATAFNIGAATTTTTVTAGPTNPTLGGTVQMTATVTPSSGSSPTGTVTFLDGTTSLGPGTLNSGQATFSTNLLSPGAHSITAAYGGTTNDGSSVSPTPVTVTVAAATTTTTLSAAPSPATVGGSTTLTAVVLPSGGPTPTGTVSFSDGATLLGSSAVNSSNGQATFTYSGLANVTTHNLSATYGGSSADGTSTGTASLIVQKAATTTVVIGLPNPQSPLTAITFQATVTNAGSPLAAPSGTVAFTNTTTGAPLGNGTLSGGVATVSNSLLTTGTYTITAVYGTDANNATSTGTFSQSVGTGTSSTALTVTPSSAAPGQSVTLTAAVSGASPTGSVIFKDGGTALNLVNSAPVSGGNATFVTSFSGGTHVLTAVYSGDGNNATSTSTSKSIVVAKVASTTTLTLSTSNPGVAGSAATFQASVTSIVGTPPTGTLNFLDGTTNIGSPSLDSNGNASLTTPSLAAGAHTITAQYVGDGENNASTSFAIPFSVNNGLPQDFALTTTFSTATMATGQSTTLALSLLGSNGFNGTVTITCAGLPQGATCVSTPPTVNVNSSVPSSVSILLTTTGSHTGSGSTSGLLRRSAIPLLGFAALFAFMRRRRWRVAALTGVLALSILSACGGGGGGGSALPGVGSGNSGANGGNTVGNGAGSSGATPAPGSTTPGQTPPTVVVPDGQPPTITAGTGLPGTISTTTGANGPVFPPVISPGTIVAGTLTPGTTVAPAGQTPAGNSTVALVATGSNGVAHPLNITVVITP